MKNLNRILVFPIALSAAFLFTEVSLGINTVIFTLISMIVLRFCYPELPWTRYLLVSLPSLLSAIFITIYPQALTKVYWCFSIGIMWASAGADLRPLLLPLQAIVGIFQSPFMIKKSSGTTSESEIKQEALKTKGVPRFLVYIMSGLIVFFFLLLYGSANPVLQEFMFDINWDFLNTQMLWNGFWYFVLFFGLIALYPNKALHRRSITDLRLERSAEHEDDKGVYSTAMISLWTLSGILLLFNAIDLVVIIGGKLPDGVSYSQYLHQGFYTLIFSIVLAILLLLFFFRGNLNFHPQVAKAKLAARQWLIQNIALSLITTTKLYLYIDAYGFTYKRISVLLCLICTGIGLLLCFQKINEAYKNWRFLNQMGLSAYIAALIFALIPYDVLITRYNLQYSELVDMYYLQGLERPDLHKMYEVTADPNHPDHHQHDNIGQRIEYTRSGYIYSDWREWNLYMANLKLLNQMETSPAEEMPLRR